MLSNRKLQNDKVAKTFCRLLEGVSRCPHVSQISSVDTSAKRRRILKDVSLSAPRVGAGGALASPQGLALSCLLTKLLLMPALLNNHNECVYSLLAQCYVGSKRRAYINMRWLEEMIWACLYKSQPCPNYYTAHKRNIQSVTVCAYGYTLWYKI